MPSAQSSLASAFGLLICVSGCYYNYGYSPYGSYPYGPGNSYPAGTYPSTLPPSTSPYVPYNGSSPTPLGSPSPTPTWTTPPPGGSPGGPARPYEPGGAPSGNGLVPNPTGDGEEEGFGPRPTSGPTSGINLQPIEAGAVPPSVAGGISLDPAMRSVSNGNSVTARTARLSDDGGQRKPFGYDLRNYTWLRGYVDFDPQDQRWIMIYSDAPDSSDRFGGSLTLSDHKLLSKIKPQDHVLIEGSVDAASFDQHGKPLYRIDKMVRLK